jgi:hypothetical protein
MTQAISSVVDLLLAADAKLFMMCLLNLPQRDQQHVESSKSFLRYLYHKTPQDFVEICQQYLRVTSWFFHEVKVADADQFFDVSKLNEARRTFEGEQADYQHNIQFVLELLETCAEENAGNLKTLSPLLLIFCYVQGHRFPEIACRIISGMTGLKSTANRLSSLAFIQRKQEDWPLDVLAPFIEISSPTYVLEWGLCCGDLVAASKALEIFEIKEQVIPESAVPILIRTMQIIAAVMHERTDPSKKQQFDQWLLKVVADDCRPQYQATVDYLQSCLKVLTRYVENTNLIPVDVFWPAADFLQCKAIEYNKLFVGAMKIVALFAVRPTFLAELKKSARNGNLLRLMFSVNSDDSTAINAIFDIMASLLNSELVELLGSEPSTVSLALFALLPYLWNKCNKRQEAESVASTLAGLVPLPAAESQLFDIVSVNTRKPDSIYALADALLSRLSEADLQLALNLGTQIVRFGTWSQREACYAIVDVVLSRKPPAEKWPSVANIAHSATTDAELHSSIILRTMLRKLVKLGIAAQHAGRLTGGKTFSMFPEMEIQMAFQTWEPKCPDVFSQFATFPPMYMSDTGFQGSQVLRDVKAVLDRMRDVPPLTHWYRQLAQVHAQEKLRQPSFEFHLPDVKDQKTFFRRLKEYHEAKSKKKT